MPYPYHRTVSKNAANNMVARAYARQELEQALVEAKIKLYMMELGDNCAELIGGLNTTLEMLIIAGGITKNPSAEFSTWLRIMRGGQSACVQLLNARRYDPLHTTSICTALDAAEKLNKKLAPATLQRALGILSRSHSLTSV